MGHPRASSRHEYGALLVDTVFIQTLLNRRDQYHNQAQAFLPRVRSATEVWITEQCS